MADDYAIAMRLADSPGTPAVGIATSARVVPSWRGYDIEIPKGFGTGKAVAVGDVDLDGAADVVFSCEGAKDEQSGVGWLKHGGDPTAGDWTVADIGGPEGVKFDRVELVDLDGDGDLDVITTEETDLLGVVWYENPTR